MNQTFWEQNAVKIIYSTLKSKDESYCIFDCFLGINMIVTMNMHGRVCYIKYWDKGLEYLLL